MPSKYPKAAVERCRDLYIKYNGTNYEAIEREMQKDWPGWSKQNLNDRNDKKRGKRLGWISEYGFERALLESIKMSSTAVLGDEQALYQGIKAVRVKLEGFVKWGEGDAAPTRDQIYQYRDFCKLEIEARRNLDLSRDNLETFVAGYEKLVVWLGQLDPAAAKALVKNGDKLVEMAELHYGTDGKEEEVGDGAVPREDEGGQPEGSGLRSV